MTDPDPQDGWERHRLEQLHANLTTTPAQRLTWLEDAIRFAWKVGALPRPEVRDADPRGDAS